MQPLVDGILLAFRLRRPFETQVAALIAAALKASNQDSVSKLLAEENGIVILETILELDITSSNLQAIFLPLLELLAVLPSTSHRKVRLLRSKITSNESLLDNIVTRGCMRFTRCPLSFWLLCEVMPTLLPAGL